MKIVGAFMDSGQKDFGPNDDFGKPGVRRGYETLLLTRNINPLISPYKSVF